MSAPADNCPPGPGQPGGPLHDAHKCVISTLHMSLKVKVVDSALLGSELAGVLVHCAVSGVLVPVL